MATLSTATLSSTIGAALLSVIGASILCGSTFAQTYMYYRNYRQDPILNKWAVGILCLLDTLHLVFLVHAVYHYSVTQYGNHEALDAIFWSLKVQALLGIVIVVLVHSLYTHRVWMLSGYHKRVLGYLVVSVVVAGAAVGILLAYVILRSQTFAVLQESAWAVYSALVVSTCIDFVLTAAMCYYLRKSRGNLDTRLNSRISKVIQYTILRLSTYPIILSTLSLVALLSYSLKPKTYIGVSLTGFGMKLYPASFFALLNSREQTNQRVSGIFNTIPHTSEHQSWRTGTDPEHFEPKSTMPEWVSGILKKISKE